MLYILLAVRHHDVGTKLESNYYLRKNPGDNHAPAESKQAKSIIKCIHDLKLTPEKACKPSESYSKWQSIQQWPFW